MSDLMTLSTGFGGIRILSVNSTLMAMPRIRILGHVCLQDKKTGIVLTIHRIQLSYIWLHNLTIEYCGGLEHWSSPHLARYAERIVN